MKKDVVLLEIKRLIGDVVEYNGERRRVERVLKVEFTYFGGTGFLRINIGSFILQKKPVRAAFFKSLGCDTEQIFMRKYMQRPVFSGTRAYCTYYYVEFTKEFFNFAM